MHLSNKGGFALNFSFKDGQFTNMKTSEPTQLKEISLDPNTLGKIVVWYDPDQGHIVRGLQFFSREERLLGSTNPDHMQPPQKPVEIPLTLNERIVGIKARTHNNDSAFLYDLQFIVTQIL